MVALHRLIIITIIIIIITCIINLKNISNYSTTIQTHCSSCFDFLIQANRELRMAKMNTQD